MPIEDLLKRTNVAREQAYDSVLANKQLLDAAQTEYNRALWDHQLLVDKISILIDQVTGDNFK